jgi:LytS/YehU family sensor histidine kinase
MSLQMLVENAIKHNEVSEDYPLTISITGTTNELIITNNLQLRSNNEPNSKTGLQNIKDRYAYYTDKKIEIIKSTYSFIVKIPLLNTL